jgi:hypothetical protein
MDGVAMAMVAGSLADADLSADEDSRVVRLAGSTVQLAVVFMEAVRPTAAAASTAAVVGSMVAVVGSTVAADTVADIGNSGLIRSLPDR